MLQKEYSRFACRWHMATGLILLKARRQSQEIFRSCHRPWYLPCRGSGQKFYSRISTAMSEATWIGRRIYELGLRIATPRADKLIDGRQPNLFDRLLFQIANVLVFRKHQGIAWPESRTFPGDGGCAGIEVPAEMVPGNWPADQRIIRSDRNRRGDRYPAIAATPRQRWRANRPR